MNITLNKNRVEFDSFISFLNELISQVKESHDAIHRIFDDLKYCHQIRKERKEFKKQVLITLDQFASLSETAKVSRELSFYKGIQELNVLVPDAIQELRKESVPIATYFLIRELKKFLAIVQNAQCHMSSSLYQNNSKEILNNPVVYQQLVDAWGDLAEED